MVTFRALVENGKAKHYNLPALNQEIARHEGREIEIEIRKPRRSPEANRRYWGRVVKSVRAHWNVGRAVPLSKDQVHHLLVRHFYGEELTPFGLVPKETRNLPSDVFSKLAEEIEAHFAADGVVFLEPGEDEDGL
jgi:hypothetical protein